MSVIVDVTTKQGSTMGTVIARISDPAGIVRDVNFWTKVLGGDATELGPYPADILRRPNPGVYEKDIVLDTQYQTEVRVELINDDGSPAGNSTTRTLPPRTVGTGTGAYLPLSGGILTGGLELAIGSIKLGHDGNGSVEIGDSLGNGTPFIDFHKGVGGVQDYNVRFINDTDNSLSVQFAAGSGRFIVNGAIQQNGVAVSLAGHAHSFASLTSTPTTLAGYGITDAFTQAAGDARYLPLNGTVADSQLSANIPRYDGTGPHAFQGTLASQGVSANKENAGHSGGVYLYGGDHASYYVALRSVAHTGAHGAVVGDWATYFAMDAHPGRGWIFKAGAGNAASISNAGHASLNGQLSAAGGVLAGPYIQMGTGSDAAIRRTDGGHLHLQSGVAGSVAIGTPSSATNKLNVGGGVLVDGSITMGGWVDFDAGNASQTAPGAYRGVRWGSTGATSYAIYKGPATSLNGPYAQLRLAWHTGIQIGAQSGYGGVRFYSNEEMSTDGAGGVSGYPRQLLFSIGEGTNHVRSYVPLMVQGGNTHDHGSVQLSNQDTWSVGSGWLYPTIGGTGGGGTGLIMLLRPHVPHAPGSDGAYLRCSAGPGAPSTWDVGAFGDQFAVRRGGVGAMLLISNTGRITNADGNPLVSSMSGSAAPTFAAADGTLYLQT